MASGKGLSRFIDIKDGINFETAVDRADNAMRMVRPEVEANVDEVVAQMSAAVAKFTAEPSEEQLRALQRLATHVAGLAGQFGRDDLGQAAYHLCELLDLDLLSGHYDAPAVAAHIQTMMLLRAPSQLKALDRVRMVAALKALVDHARIKARSKLATLDLPA